MTFAYQQSPWADVRREMIEEKGLDETVADKIGEYVQLSGNVELVDKLLQNEHLNKVPSAVAGLEATKLLLNYCNLLGLQNEIVFDLSLARGLDYYTGVIYEAILKGKIDQHFSFNSTELLFFEEHHNSELSINLVNLQSKPFHFYIPAEPSTANNVNETSAEERVGSIAGGGRYDNLVGMFDPKGKSIPCVGVSIGIERIFSVIEAKYAAEKIKMRTKLVDVYVASVHKGLYEKRLKIIGDLWNAGIRAEHSYKLNPKLLVQLQHCEEHGIPYAVVFGDGELDRGVVKLREVFSRKEDEVPLSGLAEEIRKRLIEKEV